MQTFKKVICFFPHQDQVLSSLVGEPAAHRHPHDDWPPLSLAVWPPSRRPLPRRSLSLAPSAREQHTGRRLLPPSSVPAVRLHYAAPLRSSVRTAYSSPPTSLRGEGLKHRGIPPYPLSPPAPTPTTVTLASVRFGSVLSWSLKEPANAQRVKLTVGAIRVEEPEVRRTIKKKKSCSTAAHCSSGALGGAIECSVPHRDFKTVIRFCRPSET